jgi:hypothetical protein
MLASLGNSPMHRCPLVLSRALQLLEDDPLDVFGGLGFVRGGAAAEFHGELGEHPLEAFRAAGGRRLRDLDGMLQFMRKQRGETTLRALRLDGDVEIPIVALGTMLWARYPPKACRVSFGSRYTMTSDSFSVATRRRNVAECESPASIRERILGSVAGTCRSEESSGRDRYGQH